MWQPYYFKENVENLFNDEKSNFPNLTNLKYISLWVFPWNQLL